MFFCQSIVAQLDICSVIKTIKLRSEKLFKSRHKKKESKSPKNKNNMLANEGAHKTRTKRKRARFYGR